VGLIRRGGTGLPEEIRRCGNKTNEDGQSSLAYREKGKAIREKYWGKIEGQ